MRVKAPPNYFQLIGDDDGIDIMFRVARVTVDGDGKDAVVLWDVPISQLPDLIAQAGELLGATEKKKRAARPKLKIVRPKNGEA